MEESLRTLEARAKGGDGGAFDELLDWRPEPGEPIPRREHWILDAKLGEGGFGEVWLAAHEKTKAKRVFKFCFEPERVKGLRREVVLFRLLKESLGDRDDIAHVLDWEFDRPPFFLEAEHTEGGDLAAWAEEQGGLAEIPLETRLELVAQAATALGAAHSVGVLHKDIKPGNMLVAAGTDRGRPRIRLSDFGIGVITDPGALAEMGITAAGLTEALSPSSKSSGSGTRIYMAPELIEGKQSTTFSDIYSLGVVLYQMVIGDFSRAVASGWERDIEDELLREDIAACIDGNPERRLPSAADLAERLRRLEHRRAERQAQRQTEEQAVRALRRRRQLLWVSAAGISLTLVVAFIALRESGLRQVAEAERERAEYVQYVSKIQLARSQLVDGDVVVARKTLQKTPAQYRGWEWGHLVNTAWPEPDDSQPLDASDLSLNSPVSAIWKDASVRVVQEFTNHTGSVANARFSPDGARISTSSQDRTMRIWDARTGEEDTRNRVTRTTAGIHDTAWSPDGLRLAVAGGEEFRIRQLSNETPDVTIPEGYFLEYQRVWFTPDGTRVVIADVLGYAQIVNADDGSPLSRLSAHTGPITSVQFLPDGSQMLTASADGTVRTWDLLSGQEAAPANRVPNVEKKVVAAQSISPKLDVVAAIFTDGSLMVWDLASAAERYSRPGVEILSTFSNPLAFSPDGSCVVSIFDKHTAKIWDTTTGDELASIHSRAFGLQSARFSPDGTHIVITAADSTVQLWAPFAGEIVDRSIVRAHTDVLYSLAFSPDGERIATGSYDTTVKIWDAKTLEHIFTFTGHSAEVVTVDFSSDGRRLLSLSNDGISKEWEVGSGRELNESGVSTEVGARVVASLGGIRGEWMLRTGAMSRFSPFPPDESRVVVVDGLSARVVDGRTGEEMFPLEGTLEFTTPPTYSHDASLVRLRHGIWDLNTGKKLHDEGGYNLFDFSPDDSTILTPYELRDAKTGRLLFTLEGHEGYDMGGEFSPDGNYVVTAGQDRTARIWNTATGLPIAVLRGHSLTISTAKFSPDGKRVLTVGWDDTAKIWDLEGNELVTLTGESILIDADWSPDGNTVVTYWSDGTARFSRSIPWPELAQLGDEDASLDDRIRLWHERQAAG